MFKHELGQVVQVTISGEVGHIRGVKSFLFQPNKSEPAVMVVCKKWSSDCGNIRTGISAEFEEVVL